MRLGRFTVSDCFFHEEHPRELFAVSVLFAHLIVLDARHDPQRLAYDYVAMSLDDSFEDVDVSEGIKLREVPEYTAVFHTKRSALGVESVEFSFHRSDSPSLPREATMPAHNPAIRPPRTAHEEYQSLRKHRISL